MLLFLDTRFFKADFIRCSGGKHCVHWRTFLLYLFWSIFPYEHLINGLSFWEKFICSFAFLVILTSYPELNVLLTELRFQKSCEGIQSIYRQRYWIVLNTHIYIYIYILIRQLISSGSLSRVTEQVGLPSNYIAS